ncbi:hypothetical protein RB195_012671 [Necator americanus]|uniref:Replication stress response regulator SDE2 n=1 Tax=Necator americanus TaxID=51031 RepID=A0ABR1DS29_NECAM
MSVFSKADLSKRSFYSVREENVIETIFALDPEIYFCTVDGEVFNDFHQRFRELPDDAVFQLHFRLLGGKGGFGSLLRSFRVNKSTNQLMCRDLNGRRLASIDEEQKLKKWIERLAEREKEKIAKRNAKYEKLKSGPPKHMFDDPDYIRQKETIIEKTEEAFEQGFVEFMKEAQEKKANPPVESSSDSDFDIDDLPGGSRSERKRKATKTTSVVKEKVQKLDNEDSYNSDSDSEENDIDPELLHEIHAYFSEKGKDASFKVDEPCGSKQVQEMKNTDEVASHDKGIEENSKSRKQEEKSVAKSEELPEVAVERNKTPKEMGRQEGGNVMEKNFSESEEFVDVDLAQYNTAQELEALGLQRLKHALSVRGMKCGGTLSQRAARLFSAKNSAN